MSHMVSYRGKDGKQSYHQTDELGDAIQFVEHLRNDESVDRARIFKMEELTFEYRPYYRVELAATAPPPPPPPPAGETAWLTSATAEMPADETVAHEEEADPLAAAWAASERDGSHEDPPVGAGMGRKGLFGR